MPYLRFDIWDWRAIIVSFEIRLFTAIWGSGIWVRKGSNAAEIPGCDF